MDFCPNCGSCTCTGISFVRARNNKVCCTQCVKSVNDQISIELALNPNLTINDLKRKQKNKNGTK